MGTLNGRVCIVTGTGRGLGAQRAQSVLGGRGPIASVTTSAGDTLQHFGSRGSG